MWSERAATGTGGVEPHLEFERLLEPFVGNPMRLERWMCNTRCGCRTSTDLRYQIKLQCWRVGETGRDFYLDHLIMHGPLRCGRDSGQEGGQVRLLVMRQDMIDSHSSRGKWVAVASWWKCHEG